MADNTRKYDEPYEYADGRQERIIERAKTFDVANYIDNSLSIASRLELVEHCGTRNPGTPMLLDFEDCIIGFCAQDEEGEVEPVLLYSSLAIFSKLAYTHEIEYPDALVLLADIMKNTFEKDGCPIFLNDLGLTEMDDDYDDEGAFDN